MPDNCQFSLTVLDLFHVALREDNARPAPGLSGVICGMAQAPSRPVAKLLIRLATLPEKWVWKDGFQFCRLVEGLWLRRSWLALPQGVKTAVVAPIRPGFASIFRLFPVAGG